MSTCAWVVVVGGLVAGCRPSESLPPEPEPEAAARVPDSVPVAVTSAAGPKESPCGVGRLRAQELPAAGSLTWNPPHDAMVFAETDVGAALVHTVNDVSAWAMSEIGRNGEPASARKGRFGSTDLGQRGGVDFAIGDRWAYVAETYVAQKNADVVLGDLNDPAFETVVHASPELDGDPVLTPAHGGGWAVAWARGRYPYTHDVQFALVRADGSTTDRLELEADARPEGLDVVQTPDGYAVIYARTSVERERRLVVLFVDSELTRVDRVVVTEDRSLWPSASVDPEAIGIAYRRERSGVGFVRVGFDGRVIATASISASSRGLAGVGRVSSLYHRGQYWIGFHVDYCHVHGCEDNAESYVVAVTPQGKAGQPIMLAKRGFTTVGPALGRFGKDVIAAWYHGGRSSPIFRSRISCRR